VGLPSGYDNGPGHFLAAGVPLHVFAFGRVDRCQNELHDQHEPENRPA